jgi:DNA-binding transcriptional ArsR family regulator
MSSDHERLARLISNRKGTCDEDDLKERLSELSSLNKQISGETVRMDTNMFSTLSNDTRYHIVLLLHSADHKLCVCEIEPILEVSSSAVSHALSDLYEAGLVNRSKDGKWRYYSTTDCTEQLLEAVSCARSEQEPV